MIVALKLVVKLDPLITIRKIQIITQVTKVANIHPCIYLVAQCNLMLKNSVVSSAIGIVLVVIGTAYSCKPDWIIVKPYFIRDFHFSIHAVKLH